jgi:molybdopterin synthase sulfur carrier subunit
LHGEDVAFLERKGTMIAINQSHASEADPVKDGDEIAFFPPVTGG